MLLDHFRAGVPLHQLANAVAQQFLFWRETEVHFVSLELLLELTYVVSRANLSNISLRKFAYDVFRGLPANPLPHIIR